MSLAVIGLFVLWLGWFGFNPGSTMSFQNPSDVMHILMTTNTSAIAAVLTATATSWLYLGKPDLGMTINGCLAGLVGVTGGCAYVTIEGALLIGAISGIFVVFAVVFFDRVKIDDPVGATSVHLGCGVLGTIFVGLFAKEGVTTLSTTNGLFYGGGFKLLGVELLGIVSVGAFVFVSPCWYGSFLKRPSVSAFPARKNSPDWISANTETSPILTSRPPLPLFPKRLVHLPTRLSRRCPPQRYRLQRQYLYRIMSIPALR